MATRPVVQGRGACSSPAPRFAHRRCEPVADGWWQDAEPAPATRVHADPVRRIISYNTSPDVPFDRSINPYRGCEHGCVYCFARPSHAYLELSPGLDFETELFARHEAPQRLIEALRVPGYRCAPIVLGANTDCYQPIEKRCRITRGLLEVLAEHRHPVSILTKSSLVLRDLDVLGALARDNLAHVAVSITTLDDALKRRLEPRASSGRRRLDTVRALSDAGIPVSVLLAPVIPMLNDMEIERIVVAAAEAGAASLGWVLLRLPHELAAMFRTWLEVHYPDRAARVMNRVRDTRGGRDNDSTFGRRMHGQGAYAQLIAARIDRACRRAGLGTRSAHALRTDLFTRPTRPGDQLALL